MKVNKIGVVYITMTLLFCGCSFLKPTQTVDEVFPMDQKTSLFNNKDLGYWRKSDFINSGEIEVRDSLIIIGAGLYMSGITWTGPVVPMNYEINLDAMRVAGRDFFCGLTFPYGPNFCSLILGGWGGLTVGLSNIDGEDASENETSTWVEFEQQRWYHVCLRVTPDQIQVWIDDEDIIDLDLQGKEIDIRMEVYESLPLGIATYFTTGAIKNITLTRF
jgi:hypothetical protein